MSVLMHRLSNHNKRCSPLESAGLWTYRRPAGGGLVEIGTVQGREVALPPHLHDEDQLVFVVAGQRRFLIGETVRCARAGQATLIPAGTPHRSLSESSDVVCINLYLAPGCYAVDNLMADLSRRWRSDPGLDESSLLWLVDAHQIATPEPSATNAGEGLCDVRPGPVWQAARAAGLSREGYSRRFTRLHSIPPATFRMLMQLNAARRLLRAGQPIAVVAAETGFSDQSHLGRCFRRFFGVTPGRYRAG
nr:helix-turn-helix domain-containing protein [Azohydromonas lata]